MYTNLKSTMRNEKRINIETKTTSKTTPAFGNSYKCNELVKASYTSIREKVYI